MFLFLFVVCVGLGAKGTLQKFSEQTKSLTWSHFDVTSYKKCRQIYQNILQFTRFYLSNITKYVLLRQSRAISNLWFTFIFFFLQDHDASSSNQSRKTLIQVWGKIHLEVQNRFIALFLTTNGKFFLKFLTCIFGYLINVSCGLIWKTFPPKNLLALKVRVIYIFCK